MTKSQAWRAGALVLTLCAGRTAHAQYTAPPTLERPAAALSHAVRRELLGAAMAPERGRVSQDVLVGAAIGAGAGVIGVAIAASAPGVTDHSEDGILYVAGAAAGAGLGMVVGLIVGLSRD